MAIGIFCALKIKNIKIKTSKIRIRKRKRKAGTRG